MLQDLIIAAVNEALKKVHTELSDEMSKITGGMNIPGLF
jgi:DNA-binding protein YbaB